MMLVVRHLAALAVLLAGITWPASADGYDLGPASPAGQRILSTIERIARSMRATRYQPRTIVREREGLFLWDCSGMADWVLTRAAPRAMRAIPRSRAVARDFYFAIERAPAGRAHGGWMRLAHIEDARPGDVFAWLRPPDWPRRNTGHVGFLLEAPRPVPHVPNAYTVRIVDSTSVPHQDDTRSWPGEGGFGSGTILFTTDGNGAPTAYGWHGTNSRWVVPTRIVFGRAAR